MYFLRVFLHYTRHLWGIGLVPKGRRIKKRYFYSCRKYAQFFNPFFIFSLSLKVSKCSEKRKKCRTFEISRKNIFTKSAKKPLKNNFLALKFFPIIIRPFSYNLFTESFS